MKTKDGTPTFMIAEYGLAEKGEEDSIILKVRINDKPAEIVLVFALLTDVRELKAHLANLVAGWPKDEAPE